VRNEELRSFSTTASRCGESAAALLCKVLPMATVLCLVATQSGCWEGTTRDVLATFLAVEGQGTSSSNARQKSAALAPGVHAGKGETIEIADSSRAAIALLPNLLVQLDDNAHVEILRLAITKDGNEIAPMQARYADVKIMRGRMFVSQSWGEAIAKFTVTTPHGELITTSNALFCVEPDEAKTRVTCVSGSVGWRRGEADAINRIAPGFVVELSGAASNKVAAEGDPRGQETLQEGLEIEEKLRSLISQNRYVLPR
jgi:FecR protein